MTPRVEGALRRTWEELGRPILAVEVISPLTAITDRRDKRELYQRKGVPEYCVVDVDARTIERWRIDHAEPGALSETLEWRPDRAVAPFVFDLAAYFARVTGI